MKWPASPATRWAASIALANTTRLAETFKPYTTGHREDRFRVSALKLLGYHAGRAGQNDVAAEAYATLLDEYGENYKDQKGDLVPMPMKDRLRSGNTRWDGIRAEVPKDLDPGEVRFALGYLYWKAEDWQRCVKTLTPFLDDVKLAKNKSRDKALYMAGQSSCTSFTITRAACASSRPSCGSIQSSMPSRRPMFSPRGDWSRRRNGATWN